MNFIFEISDPWDFQDSHGDCDNKINFIFEISEPWDFRGSHGDCDKNKFYF